MDYERERRRQKRYREAMRNRIIAAVLLAGIIVGAIFIIKGCKKDDAPADDAQNTNQPVDNVGDTTTPDNVIVDDELLTLVNPWNPLPDDWTVDPVTLDDGHRVDSRCYIVDDQSMIAMVACGRGFAIMPELMFKTGTDPHGCQVLRLEPAATRSIGLACLARGALSPAARQFAARARAYAASLRQK